MTNPDLQLAPIHFPVVGNSVIVGIVSLLHIALASLSVGFMLLAPIFEAMGRTNPLYTALARGITRFTLIVFSASAVLAVIMVELFIGLFPVTTMWIWNQFRHLLYLGVAAFFLQLFALYPYYHYWEAIRRHSVRLHLLMGIMAAALILIWVIVLDGMGSYMLTPTDRPGRWPDPLNPTWLPLALHRLIGDFVIAGYGLAGYAAWRLGRWERRSPETPNGTDPSAAYFGHVLKTGFAVGLIGLLLQPVTGLLYAHHIQRAAPDAYANLLHGRYQILLYLQFTLLGLLFIGSHVWIKTAQGVPRLAWRDLPLVLSVLLMIATAGYPILRRGFTFLAVALTIWQLLSSMEATSQNNVAFARPTVRRLSIGLGVVSLLMYLAMGTIRKTARHPDTVQGIISLQDEVLRHR